MKRKWRKGIIGGLSFTSALFIFQACYGMPQDFYDDIQLSGQVKSKTTGQALAGIKVSLKEMGHDQLTDELGEFLFFSHEIEKATLVFEDVDGEENGNYASMDTVITRPGERVVLDIELEEN
jgi:hypothetical protein